MKMETPKMDVVRFKEADVIVASPAPTPVYTTKARGFNNEIPSDASIEYNDVVYTDYQSLNNALAKDGLRGMYQLYVPNQVTDSQYSTHDMFLLDADDNPGMEHSILIPDGTYQWNATEGCFIRKQ